MLRSQKPAAQRKRHRFGGYPRSSSVLKFNSDGLVIAGDKTERPWLPIWHVVVFVYLALLIRLVAMAEIGPGGYTSRIEEMRNGNVVEQVAAFVMQMDPVSQKLALEIRDGLDWFASL